MHGNVRSLDSVLCEGNLDLKRVGEMTVHFIHSLGNANRVDILYRVVVYNKQSRHSLSLVFMGHAWLFCGEKLWKDGERRAVGKAS